MFSYNKNNKEIYERFRRLLLHEAKVGESHKSMGTNKVREYVGHE